MYYDSEGASPASDDSNPAFYDSPASSEGPALADDCRHYSVAEQAYYRRSDTSPPADEFAGQDAYTRTAGNTMGYDGDATQWRADPQGH